jgi:hypothetical protein
MPILSRGTMRDGIVFTPGKFQRPFADAAADRSDKLNMFKKIFTTGLLIMAGSAAVMSQDGGSFRVGGAVEAHSYFFNPPWHSAKVISIGSPCDPVKPYRVHFTGPDAGDHGDPCVGSNEIRAIAAPGNVPPAQTPPDRGPGNAGAGFGIGDRVDVFSENNRDKGARGTIIEVSGNSYKIHYDGCESYKDVVVDREELHPAASVSNTDPDIQFLIGSWKMFTPSYPNTVVRGNTIYREYGMGASAPPLSIKPDGTYIWYDQYNKPPVKGTWRADAMIEGAKFWVAFTDGVVIKDSAGVEWKAYRWKFDNQDRITVKTLCSGLTVDGTRVR